ncbi:hypothetical protein COB55_04930, partial [Candidatus Wolfebacteria bacterium]
LNLNRKGILMEETKISLVRMITERQFVLILRHDAGKLYGIGIPLLTKTLKFIASRSSRTFTLQCKTGRGITKYTPANGSGFTIFDIIPNAGMEYERLLVHKKTGKFELEKISEPIQLVLSTSSLLKIRSTMKTLMCAAKGSNINPLLEIT